jgi:hypothetical protein
MLFPEIELDAVVQEDDADDPSKEFMKIRKKSA